MQTILLVDDNQLFLRARSELFTGYELNIITAAGPRQALDILKSDTTIDLLLSDVKMHGDDDAGLSL